MPLSGTAMLVNFMNIDPADEPDFNRWYNKEHLAERVAIPGFLEARRYVAEEAPQKYLGVYTTESLDVLDSDVYRHALANQTQWSRANIARFRDATRACALVTASQGEGRGAALGFVRLRPQGADAAALRDELAGRLTTMIDLDGVVSGHLIESDPALSKPIKDDPDAAAGSGDWYVLIDATSAAAVRIALERFAVDDVATQRLQKIFAGVYRLLFDLAKAELQR